MSYYPLTLQISIGMNILIIKLSSIGDVVHSLPTLSALRGLYPEAHIAWLVEEEAYDILQGHPYIDRVILSKKNTWLKNLHHPSQISATLREVYDFVKEIRDHKYDLVIDLQGLLKSGILVFFSRGIRRVGYDGTRELSYLFLNERIKANNPDEHAVIRYLNVASYLGANCTHPDFQIPISEREKEYIDGVINHSERPIIAISPMARWKTKQWPHDRFAKLADKISQELDAKVVFTGGKGDRDDVQQIIALMKTEAINLAGKTTLKDLAYLFKRANLVVSTDSGPMHIAAAVGSEVIALFGPTSPSRTGPFEEGHIIIRKDLPCSPCFKKRCQTLECMAGITVDDVFSKVSALLLKTQKTNAHFT